MVEIHALLKVMHLYQRPATQGEVPAHQHTDAPIDRRLQRRRRGVDRTEQRVPAGNSTPMRKRLHGAKCHFVIG
ncbi:hypothetical protein D3C72_2448030 [compost metagenome]